MSSVELLLPWFGIPGTRSQGTSPRPGKVGTVSGAASRAGMPPKEA